MAAADAVDDVWSDDALLDTTVVLPWATMTGAEMLAMYVSEITTHTWDLANATGQSPKWDDAVCQLSLDTMHRDLPMADRTPMWEAFKATMPANMQFDAPFANAVAVGTDAPLIDQLVAWTGSPAVDHRCRASLLLHHRGGRPPRVRQHVPRGPWIIGIDEVVMQAGDPCPAPDGGLDRRVRTDGRLADDGAVELRIDDRRMSQPATHLQHPSCVQHGHAGRGAGARSVIDPSGRVRRCRCCGR